MAGCEWSGVSGCGGVAWVGGGFGVARGTIGGEYQRGPGARKRPAQSSEETAAAARSASVREWGWPGCVTRTQRVEGRVGLQ